MTASLQCPTCSAPLDPPAHGARMMTCPYCGASALLTERLGHVEATAAHDRRTDALSDVVRLLRLGRKRAAVEVYRNLLGVTREAAADAVSRIEAGQPAGSGGARAPAHRAVLAVLVACVALAGLAALLLAQDSSEAAPGSPPPPSPAAAADGAPSAAAPSAAEPAFAEPVLRFGREGTGAGRFEDARSVAVDGTGRIYVAEYQGGRVQVFDSLGTFLTQWTADPEMPLTGFA